MTEWEHGLLIGITLEHGSKLKTHYPTFLQFTPEGVERRELAGTGDRQLQATSSMIAELGQQGWELAGTTYSDKGLILAFKRPKTT